MQNTVGKIFYLVNSLKVTFLSVCSSVRSSLRPWEQIIFLVNYISETRSEPEVDQNVSIWSIFRSGSWKSDSFRGTGTWFYTWNELIRNVRDPQAQGLCALRFVCMKLIFSNQTNMYMTMRFAKKINKIKKKKTV